MKLFINTLSSGSDIPDPVVENPFSQEASVDPINYPNDWKGFPCLVYVGDKLYSFYRLGTLHVQDLGSTIQYRVSEDDGETWSNRTLFYDGLENFARFPSEPNTKLDVRDARGTGYLMSNGRYLFGTFVIMASVYTSPFISVGVNESGLDFNDKIINYIDDIVLGGNLIEHNSIIYAPMYYGDGNTWCYTSNDFGLTWVQKGKMTVAGDTDWEGNEASFYFLGNKLVCTVRQVGEGHSDLIPNIIIESDDYGVTWINRRKFEYKQDGPDMISLNDDKVAVVGRTPFSYQDDITTYLSVIDWSTGLEVSGLKLEADPDFQPRCADRGYNQIIKYRDKYFVCYYKGQATTQNLSNGYGGVYFRQLNYNENTYTFTFGND